MKVGKINHGIPLPRGSSLLPSLLSSGRHHLRVRGKSGRGGPIRPARGYKHKIAISFFPNRKSRLITRLSFVGRAGRGPRRPRVGSRAFHKLNMHIPFPETCPAGPHLRPSGSSNKKKKKNKKTQRDIVSSTWHNATWSFGRETNRLSTPPNY